MFSTIALDPFSTMNRWLITQKKKQSNVLASRMERSVGSLQEQALKRKERLKALRGRQLQVDKSLCIFLYIEGIYI